MAHYVVEMIMKCMYVKRVNPFPSNICLKYIMRECVMISQRMPPVFSN